MDLESILEARQNLTMMVSQLNQFSGFVLLLLTVFSLPGMGIRIEQCKGVNMADVVDHMAHINECLKEAGVTEVKDIPAEKLPCFGKCFFIRKGLLDDKGVPHKEKIQTMITDNMPKEVHDDLNKRVAQCLLPNNTEIIDPTDKSCETYLPIMMCIDVAFLEECA